MTTESRLTEIELGELRNAVIQAGDLIKRIGERTTFGIYFKSFDNPVTDADLESNRILTDYLKEHYPQDAIVSEEDYTDQNRESLDELRGTRDRIWSIDPLDGTREFIAELPYYTVSMGLILNNRAELGFVYNPVKQVLIWGGEKYGYFKNDKKIGSPRKLPQKLSDCKIALSQTEYDDGLFKKLAKEVPKENITFIGSIAYKLAFTAAGEFDLLISKRPKADWDISGGAAQFSRKGLALYDKKFKPLGLNGKKIYSDGLIAGKSSAIELYKEFTNR